MWELPPVFASARNFNCYFSYLSDRRCAESGHIKHAKCIMKNNDWSLSSDGSGQTETRYHAQGTWVDNLYMYRKVISGIAYLFPVSCLFHCLGEGATLIIFVQRVPGTDWLSEVFCHVWARHRLREMPCDEHGIGSLTPLPKHECHHPTANYPVCLGIISVCAEDLYFSCLIDCVELNLWWNPFI